MQKMTQTLFAALVVCGALAASASAAVVTHTISMQYTGDQPDGYLVLEFSDEAIGLADGEVKLTLTGFLEGPEDAKTLGFNFDANGDTASALGDMTFTNEMTTGGFTGVSSIETGVDNQQSDLGPQGGFDIIFIMPNGNPDGRFNGSDTLMLTLASSIDLNANMFDATNSDGVAAAAHIRQTDGQAGSGKIKDGRTPEIPTPAALPAGLALLGLAAMRRRRNA